MRYSVFRLKISVEQEFVKELNQNDLNPDEPKIKDYFIHETGKD